MSNRTTGERSFFQRSAPQTALDRRLLRISRQLELLSQSISFVTSEVNDAVNLLESPPPSAETPVRAPTAKRKYRGVSDKELFEINAEAEPCGICQERLIRRNMLETSCGHSFCGDCYVRWFDTKAANMVARGEQIPDKMDCPLCRTTIEYTTHYRLRTERASNKRSKTQK